MGKSFLTMIQRILLKLKKLLYSPEKWARYLGVRLGDNCMVGKDHWSTEPYLITIGNHVQLTDGVCIHTHGGGNCVRIFNPTFDCFGKVVIEDWAYIGSGAHIMPGVTIGRGALVAAGSIVTKSVKPGTLVGGNPARFICTVEEYYNKNRQFNIETKGINPYEKKKRLLALPDSIFIKK